MNLQKKIAQRRAVLGVVGLGYVGLPLAITQARAGFQVVGVDIDPQKVRKVEEGKSYINDVDSKDVASQLEKGMLRASTDFDQLAACDCICVAVPTPLDAHQQPDISFVRASIEGILPILRPGMLVVLESTTYPRTTEEVVLPMLEAGDLRCGTDFFLAFSPERVDPGNSQYTTLNTPKIVGGVTRACTEIAATLYEAILDAPVHRVSSPAVAEMSKILENTYRNVNVGLINEMAILCKRIDIDIWEVIEAAKTKPFGFQAFYPGPGLGGHCIPIDPCYLSWKAKEFGFHVSMIEASMMINDRMPEYCIERVYRILNRFSKAVRGTRILVLGVAYKKDVSDCRGSPAIELIEKLLQHGAVLSYYDPFVPTCQVGETRLISLPSLGTEEVARADLVIIPVDHTAVDYAMVQTCAPMIFDLKNATSALGRRSNVELL